MTLKATMLSDAQLKLAGFVELTPIVPLRAGEQRRTIWAKSALRDVVTGKITPELGSHALSLICLSVGIAKDTLSVPPEIKRRSRISNGYKAIIKSGSWHCAIRAPAGGFSADLRGKIDLSRLAFSSAGISAIWTIIRLKHRKFLWNGMFCFQMFLPTKGLRFKTIWENL